MPQQEYIKYLYEKEELSINQIRQRVDINWRTAAKYAQNEDWNKIVNVIVNKNSPFMAEKIPHRF